MEALALKGVLSSLYAIHLLQRNDLYKDDFQKRVLMFCICPLLSLGSRSGLTHWKSQSVACGMPLLSHDGVDARRPYELHNVE